MSTVFDDNANEYDKWFEVNDLLYKSELDAVSHMLDKDRTYIEVGVGTGLFATKLGICEGVEPCNEMSDIAASRGIRVHDATAQHLPYEDNSLEGIVMITVDCFVKDIMPVFREAHRALKTGGSYIMAFLDRGSPLGECYEANKENDIYYKDATFRSTDEMKGYLDEAGLRVVDTVNTVYTLDNEYQPYENGTGKGVFAIIKATKETR